VPTLEEALDLFAELGLGFNMEIKPAAGREIETAQAALTIARSCWDPSAVLPLISSFSRISVAAAKEVQPGWPRGILFDHVAEDWREAAAKLDVLSVGANHKHLTPELVAAIHADGRRVTAYTVNETARAEALFSWGVDAVFTDRPGALLKNFP
jgi:glycerophosphoryl diester phosphodiesterase